MIQPPPAPSLPAESFSVLWLVALLILIAVLRPAPSVALPRPTIALARPRFAALSADEAASASRLLGSVAAETMAHMREGWR
jgi:hypothetical protein